MVKSDEHMGKVKANLLTQKSNIEKREKARQMRHQKKFAKDVQRYVQGVATNQMSAHNLKTVLTIFLAMRN